MEKPWVMPRAVALSVIASPKGEAISCFRWLEIAHLHLRRSAPLRFGDIADAGVTAFAMTRTEYLGVLQDVLSDFATAVCNGLSVLDALVDL